ncbi:MAG: DUF4252 domain-containing protein [Saprospiraceae bacterium]|nr:DUF4252 domain-containing protein [Saprospiraceae bacterium]
MKNLLSLLLIVFVSSSIFGQGIIERNYSQYVDQEDVTHVYVSGKLFDFASIIASNVEDEEVRELSEFASKIESFSLIKVPNTTKADAEYKKGLNDVQGEYEELMRVRDEGTKFVVFVDEENDVVYEIVGLGVVDGEFIALSLVGEMDLNKIAEFISKADSEAFEPLKRLEEFNPEEMKVYPNPTNVSSEINLEVPEAMIGGKAVLFDANGSKIKTFDVSSKKQTISTDNLRPGNYFIELNKETVSMKKQVIVVQ